jgi:hypothetical protein
MPKLVHIPKIGHVSFPDGMKDEEINEAAGRLHDDARNAGISKFMENDPAHQGMSHAEKLKALANIAAMHEKYPRLADAVDKGMKHVSPLMSRSPSSQHGNNDRNAKD